MSGGPVALTSHARA